MLKHCIRRRPQSGVMPHAIVTTLSWFGACILRPVTGSLYVDAADLHMQAFISSRLDYCNALLYGVSDGLMCRLIGPERRRATCNRRAEAWQHHADSMTAPLAARASTSDLQDRRSDLPVSDWPGTGVSGRRLSAYFRRQHAPTPIDRHSDVRRPTFK